MDLPKWASWGLGVVSSVILAAGVVVSLTHGSPDRPNPTNVGEGAEVVADVVATIQARVLSDTANARVALETSTVEDCFAPGGAPGKAAHTRTVFAGAHSTLLAESVIAAVEDNYGEVAFFTFPPEVLELQHVSLWGFSPSSEIYVDLESQLNTVEVIVSSACFAQSQEF